MAHVDVLSMGMAAGECALARGFVAAATRRGHEVRAFTVGQTFAAALRRAGATVVDNARPVDVMDAFSQRRLLVCATSLTCVQAGLAVADLPGSLISLESSWLPWIQEDPGRYTRFDHHLVAMPADVFDAGLGPNAGRWHLSPARLAKTTPVGWFAPSPGAPRSEPNLGEPNVLIYLGRACKPSHFPCRETLGPAIARLAARRPDLRWRFVGPELGLPNCVERIEDWVPEEVLSRWHVEASLVVCHHGQVTIGRAAAAGVPVLAIADGRLFRAGALEAWGDQEVHAFARAGVVEGVHGACPADTLARRMEALLDRGPRVQQGGGGADRAVTELERWL